MVENLFVKCDVCGSIIDLKWQVRYLSNTEFQISYEKCKGTIKGTFNINNNGIELIIMN